MTVILLRFFSPITETDIPTSEYSSAYLYTNFDYNSNTSSNMSHWSSRGYIFPRKHAGFNWKKVSQNVGRVGER